MGYLVNAAKSNGTDKEKTVIEKFGIILTVVLLVAGLATVVGCGNTQQSELEKQAKEAIKGAITNTSGEDTPSVEGSVGEAVKLGDIEVKVVEWKFATPEDYNKPYERPENRLVVVDVEVVNNSAESFQCDSTNNMRIRTPDGYEYVEWNYVLPEPQFPPTAMDSGERSRGFVTFEVPRDIGAMYFQFDTFETGKAKIKLQ